MAMRTNVVDFSNHSDFGPGDIARIDEVCAGLQRFSMGRQDVPVSESEAMDAESAFEMSLRDDLSPRERSGWLWVAASKGHYVAVEQMSASARIRSLQFADAARRAEARRVADAWDEMARRLLDGASAGPYEDRNGLVDDVVDASDGLVVIEAIGDSLSVAARDLLQKYGRLQGKPLPWKGRAPNPAVFAEEFAQNWPWAGEVAQRLAGVMESMRSPDGARKALPPILLVGDKRSGIDSMVRMLARRIGAPLRTLSCRGANDAGLSATPRGWPSSRPGFAARAMLEADCCDPIVFLDGLGSGGESLDGLRAVLGGSECWDACLEAPVRVEGIGVVASTEDATCLPEDIVDRFTVLRVGAPRLEDFDALVRSCDGRFAEENGLFDGEMPAMGAAESALLREFYASTLSFDEFVHAHECMAKARLAESTLGRIIH